MAESRDVRHSIVRIFVGDTPNLAGLGFSVEPNQILTCAHVVQFASGLSATEIQGASGLRLRIDWPEYPAVGRVWANLTSLEPLGKDIALLVLANDLAIPDSVREPRASLKQVPESDLERLRFAVFGFASGDAEGEKVIGRVKGRAFRDQVRLVGDDEYDFFIGPGFSGTPVLDATDLRVVLGMITSVYEEDGSSSAKITEGRRAKPGKILSAKMLPTEAIVDAIGYAEPPRDGADKEGAGSVVEAGGAGSAAHTTARSGHEPPPGRDDHDNDGDRGSDPLEPFGVALLSHNITTIYTDVRELWFTPIVGSGCSLVGRSQSAAWHAVALQAKLVLDNLTEDPEAQRYLRGLMAISPYDVPSGEPSSPPAVPPDWILVRGLQLNLARLGAQLNKLFASAMLESLTPVWDSNSYRIVVPESDSQLPDVRELLVACCVAAGEVSSVLASSDPDQGLGIRGIYERLLELTAELTDESSIEKTGISTGMERSGGMTVEVVHGIAAQRRQLALEGVSSNGSVTLSIHQLEWLADALWHTFRYDKPAYPRTDEFAFQISLFADRMREGRGWTRKPAATEAFQVGHTHPTLSPKVMAGWFRKYGESEESSPRMIEFYDTLARLLVCQFEEFRDTTSSLDPLEPMAFSTTYDLELESALHRLPDGGTFQVLIPVTAEHSRQVDRAARNNRSPKGPSLHWLLGTTRKQDELINPEWEWFPPDKRLAREDWEGPIIVKLHGSPLHGLPTPRRVAGRPASYPEYERFEHALILSEGQYLQSIVGSSDPLPGTFHTALVHPDRALYFLGQSISEWNTRLRMYDYVYRRDHPPSKARRIAINRSHDPYRTAVLRSLKIHRWVGDLEELTNAMKDALPSGVLR